ncbi:MAG: hypothetical protein LBF22_15395 [Deltaproteobacteria bacterium]|jgi:hypothetical protein|nr:hypothetical protein [Deltaproteobacteria bacterium]
MIGLKKILNVLSRGYLVILLGTVILGLSGCVLSMPDPLLKSRTLAKGVIPTSIVGVWLDSERSAFRIQPTNFNNTYSAIPEKGGANLKLTFERLEDNLFIIQVEPDGSKGVFLTIGVIEPKVVTIYTYPDSLIEIQEIGTRNGVTITNEGLITKYETAQGVVKFFWELSALPGHKDVPYTKK